MSPLLQQMLTESPMMQQMLASSAPGMAGLPSLPSSADLLQQAHALQLLAQLQSVLMMNTNLARDQQQSNKVRKASLGRKVGSLRQQGKRETYEFGALILNSI